MYDYAISLDDFVGFWGIEEYVLDLLSENYAHIVRIGDRFMLKGRESLALKSERAEKIATQKLEKAREILKEMGDLPWVKMVGISGSVGAKNAKRSDDIDVFIISEDKRMFLTRFYDWYWYGVVKKIRNFTQATNRRDHMCFNVHMTDGDLVLDEDLRNLFVAYQTVLVTPIYGGDIYKEFLSSNVWIKEHFPWYRGVAQAPAQIKKHGLWVKLKRMPLDIIDFFLGIGQWLKIIFSRGNFKNKSRKKLFFHPEDPTERVLRSYEMRLRDVLIGSDLDL